jgi:pyruvate/2-oxoglutarate dehydrogenase complex dihydrolipoamide dehydrogenase (E3) component
MPESEKFQLVIVGSGQGGKLLAWYLAKSGLRTAVVERRWVGGSCPNSPTLPWTTSASFETISPEARVRPVIASSRIACSQIHRWPMSG